jgi:hypothetical protein
MGLACKLHVPAARVEKPAVHDRAVDAGHLDAHRGGGDRPLRSRTRRPAHHRARAPPPPHRKTNTLKVALISLIGGLALCLGSLVMFAATVATPDKTTPARAADTATAAASPRPVAVLPTTTPTPPQAAHTGTRRPHTTSTARRAIPRPHRTTTRPRPKPTTTKPAGRRGVHPGAFCTPEGAIGYTTAGTRMRCTAKAGEDQARWRRA